MDELIAKIKGLPASHRDFLIFTLLLEGIISYEEISKLYVNSLEEKNTKQREKISHLMVPLAYYWTAYKGKSKQDKWIKSKSAHHLKKFYKSAGFEKDCDKWLNKNPYDRADEEN